jgi:hypothetical protein
MDQVPRWLEPEIREVGEEYRGDRAAHFTGTGTQRLGRGKDFVSDRAGAVLGVPKEMTLS